MKSISISQCQNLPTDYTHMWWADGWRGRSAKGELIRCMQTGHYGFAMDVEKMKILHMGPITNAVSYEEAASQSNAAVYALPPADLALNIDANGKTYTCTRGGIGNTESRLVDSGRIAQTGDITNLEFKNAQGEVLNAEARFEVLALPESIALTLEAAPKYLEFHAGPAWGKIKNGYYFDGKNFLDVPSKPNVDPGQFTLTAWVFLPKGAVAKNTNSWVICKGANEWEDGNMGIMLKAAAPIAIMNIGGKAENAFEAKAAAALEEEKWNALAMSYDGKDLLLYVNGSEAAKTPVAKKRTTDPAKWTFGHRQDAKEGYNFTGLLDEVRLYSAALSPAEIVSRIAAESSPGAPSNAPVAAQEWTFDKPGEPQLVRPGDEWKNMGMTMSLTKDGKTQTVSMPRGTDGRFGQKNTVVMAIDPIACGTVQAPASSDILAKNLVTNEPLSVLNHYPNVIDVETSDLKAAGEGRHTMERIGLNVRNNSDAPKAYVIRILKNSGFDVTGMSPIIRDMQGNPTGIPAQISKDWHGVTWYHGFFILRLPAQSQTEFEYSIVYGYWGKLLAVSHAQLSLIGYAQYQQWDEVALGSWGEAVCYDPDVNCCRAMIDDVRPMMVTSMDKASPQWSWGNNVGGGDFLVYFNEKNEKQYLSRMRSAFLSYCPNLSRVQYCGVSADGKIEAKITVSTPRTDDFLRCYHTIRYDVVKPVSFKRLAFYQLGADGYNSLDFNKIARGDLTGIKEEWPLEQKASGKYIRTGIDAAGKQPWFSLHDSKRMDDTPGAAANRGIVIRSWKARLNGKDVPNPTAALFGAAPSAVLEITGPADLTQLVPGDYVEAEIEMIIMPQFQKDYYGPNENLHLALGKMENTSGMILREAAGNDLVVTARNAKVEHSYPVVVRKSSGNLEVTITGGAGYVPLTIKGLERPSPWKLYSVADGKETEVNQATFGNDFWQTDYDPKSKTWSLTYNVSLDSPNDRKIARVFRLKGK